MRTLQLFGVVLPMLIASAKAQEASARFAVRDLTCQHLREPRGLDVRRPLLSWRLRSTDAAARGQVQSAYRIMVATDMERLREGAADLWDSGAVRSDRTAHLPYAGAELHSHQSCYWKVRAWDGDGRPTAWSEVATFTMGMLDPSDWSAKWIGFDAPLAEKSGGPDFAGASWIWFADDPQQVPDGVRRLFRKRFRLPAGELAEAQLWIAADNAYTLWINGREVGRGSDWGKPSKITCSEFLRPGDNLLAVAATNAGGPAGLIVSLQATPAAGEPIRCVSDASWRCADVAADDGWVGAAFDDRGWPAARVVAGYGGQPWRELRAEGLVLPPARYLRRDFDSGDGELLRATLYASALGLYRMSLNGKRVGDDWFAPGWTDYDKRIYYRAYDVTGLVGKGANALGAVVADGWYAGYVGYKPERHHYGDRTRLLAQLRLEYADGRVDTVVSDGSWKAALGPLLEADFLMGERYDARLEQDGWDRVGLDESGWQPVDVTAAVSGRLQAHPSYPVRVIEELRAKTITEPRPGVYVLDLGQNFAGVSRLTVQGAEAGQEIVLRFAERLDANGNVYTKNLRAARATDVYVCRGLDREVWTPAFTFHGFQYVEITGLHYRPQPDTVVGLALSSDVPKVGTFECSDPMINRLYENIRWTQAANFIEVPTDCPQRDERLGWTGDAQVYVRTAATVSDVRAFFGKWLVDLTDAQRPDGQFPMVAPLKVAGGDGGPAWADAGVIVPWAIYQVYGDPSVLERNYPAMAKFIAFCAGRSRDGGLPPEKFHCFGDWLNIGDETPKEVIYTAYFAHSTDLMARAAAVLGRDADAKRYRQLFNQIVATFNREYVESDGQIRGHTQCAYVMALAFGLVSGERWAHAERHLLAHIEKRGWHLSTGFVGTKDLMLVLSAIGRDDVAYRLLHNRTFPSWGFTIEHGATSIWERWNGWTPDKGFGNPGMNSFAHYSFGAVGQWMYQTIGGIQPLQPGFREILIRPRPGGELTWAKVGYESVAGRVSTAWRWDGDGLSLDVEVPVNTVAEVHVPCADDAEVMEGGAPLSDSAGVKLLPRRDGAAVVRLGSGRYRFRTR